MNRRSFLTQCTLASTGLAAFIQGCQPAGSTENVTVADGSGQQVTASREDAILVPPAIDASPPTRYETATFALG